MYAQHLEIRRAAAEAALEASGFDAMVLASGSALRYHADDQHAPFRSNAHFLHWLPLGGPGHLLHVRSGSRPRLLRVLANDYWHASESADDALFAGEMEVHTVADTQQAWTVLGAPAATAYVGDQPERALAAGFPAGAVNPPALLARLDWDRGCKTAWEVHCMEQAQRLAARGHRAAREAFDAGGSELDIHHAYVDALECVDADLPYESIIALDAHAATLHYTLKGTGKGGRVLLIDCGARHLGYCADITRTWTREGCDRLFEELRIAMDAIQRSLCERLAPGCSFVGLHLETHRRIADLLHAFGVLKAGGQAAVDAGLTVPFYPHGLGHHLGLQVHDVGGRQSAPAGGETPPPPGHPHLRNTRTLAAGQVLTIEPGVYFIDMLLAPLRAGPHRSQVDWKLVERLQPLGGVRVEDNVLVTEDGRRNLTRPHI